MIANGDGPRSAAITARPVGRRRHHDEHPQAPARPPGRSSPSRSPRSPTAQTLTLLFPQEPGSLLPHFDLLSLAHEAQDLVFDRLFVVDEDGAYLPHLAEEVPTVANGGISADGRVYTIRLREGPAGTTARP
jgi:ABC-type transport system substrate-binding protein